MKDIPWNVRVDASVDPVCVVFAQEWYDARATASLLLFIEERRIYVSQFNDREMREYMMPRAMPAWKAEALYEAQARITARRFRLLGEAFKAHEKAERTCAHRADVLILDAAETFPDHPRVDWCARCGALIDTVTDKEIAKPTGDY